MTKHIIDKIAVEEKDLADLINLISDAMPVVGEAFEKLRRIQKLQQELIEKRCDDVK
jgi:hypothetical protein